MGTTSPSSCPPRSSPPLGCDPGEGDVPVLAVFGAPRKHPPQIHRRTVEVSQGGEVWAGHGIGEQVAALESIETTLGVSSRTWPRVTSRAEVNPRAVSSKSSGFLTSADCGGANVTESVVQLACLR